MSPLDQLATEPQRLTGQEMAPALLARIAGIDPATAYARLRIACQRGHAVHEGRGRYRITTGWLPALRGLVCPKHQGQPVAEAVAVEGPAG